MSISGLSCQFPPTYRHDFAITTASYLLRFKIAEFKCTATAIKGNATLYLGSGHELL